MYELNLIGDHREKFKAAAKKRMRERGWQMQDLADAVGRPINTLYSFFKKNDEPQRFLAAEIANVLEMERKEWD